MSSKRISYHIEVQGHSWLDNFTVRSADSDKEFLESYSETLAELKQKIELAGNPDYENYTYRAIKRTRTITDEVLA